MQAFPKDTLMTVSVYYITDYKSPQRPYEGHYLHTGVKMRTEKQSIQFYKGDYLIPDQSGHQPVYRGNARTTGC